MQVADPRSLIDRLYQDWRQYEAQHRVALADAAAAYRDDTTSVHVAADQEVTHQATMAQAAKWALATVLHFVEKQSTKDLHRDVVNWTYGCNLADDYHRLVRDLHRVNSDALKAS